MSAPLSPQEERYLRFCRSIGGAPTEYGPVEAIDRLLATLEAERAKDEASLEAVRAAHREMKHRHDDLRWCNKDDDCEMKAEGVALAIDDFEHVLEERDPALATVLKSPAPDTVSPNPESKDPTPADKAARP